MALVQHQFEVNELPWFAAVVAIVLVVSALARQWVLDRPERGGYQGQLALFLFLLAGALMILLSLPLEASIHSEVFKLAGIVLSAALALSSTTFVGNLIAGGMLRTVSHFRVDDWIRVGEHFGRVTERGLLHTEIQTEQSDLTTLPNLMLATQPVTVVRTSGTIVTAEAGIGYDVPHAHVEEALLAAAREAELEQAFVSIVELGDYAVTYRVNGRLDDVDRLMSRRSALRRAMLDSLHEAGIEIMSPSFMNVLQRRAGQAVIPAETGRTREAGAAPEDVVFDKSKAAKTLEEYRVTIGEMKAKVREIDGRLGDLEGDEKDRLEWERARIQGEIKRFEGIVVDLEEQFGVG